MISALLINLIRRFLFYKYFLGDDYVNTSGYIRGYMSKNMKAEDFIKVVVSALNREFEEIKEGVSLEYNDNEFIISMGKYKVVISKELIDKLKSPYGIDKYILE